MTKDNKLQREVALRNEKLRVMKAAITTAREEFRAANKAIKKASYMDSYSETFAKVPSLQRFFVMKELKLRVEVRRTKKILDDACSVVISK